MVEYKVRLKRNSRRPFMVEERKIDYSSARRMSNPEEIVRMMNDVYDIGGLAEEHTYMLAMNGKFDATGLFLVGMGTVNQCPVGPRELFTRALLAGATCIALVHNHPSGDPTPSPEDRALAKRVATAGEMIGISLADMIIVGRDSYVSLRGVDEEWVQPFEMKDAWKI